MTSEKIVIVDFGSQYTQLIARRVREFRVYSEIVHPEKAAESINESCIGIILSGGPNSVYDKLSPQIDLSIIPDGMPVLGICYGMQLLSHKLGGKVEKSDEREFGKALLKIKKDSLLFKGIKNESVVWMSHSDKVTLLPPGFEVIGTSGNTPNAAMHMKGGRVYGLQFHPEVVHTEFGKRIIGNFVKVICSAHSLWNSSNFINETIEKIKTDAPSGGVIAGISGGVDSTVASALVQAAVGKRFRGFLVDTGLLRHNEGKDTVKLLREKMKFNIEYVDASSHFMEKLKGVKDPERKRKIIGKAFINVFEEQAKKYRNALYLVQGTIYPDRIESSSVKGPSHVIKSHHNVGGLPKRMRLKLIEPLAQLFKDEVREVGYALGIPAELLQRHPFPGPGLGIRIIGDINPERVKILQHADRIYIETIRKHGCYDKIWQAFSVFLPVKSVGVMGDCRTYENVLVLRAVTSVDGMTADWYDFDKEILHEASTRIINEVKGINRVVYDVSTKPPSTIEWE